MNMKRIASVIFVAIGILLLSLPTIINRIDQKKNDEELTKQMESDEGKDSEESELQQLIDRYNERKTDENYAALPSQLGHIRIRGIDITYPLYKTTSEDVLSRGIGHFEETNIPSDATGTHSVFVGHNGVYGQDFFSNIDKLGEGSEVEIIIENKTYVYVVTNKRVVLPEGVGFPLVADKNMLTLVTCTPYGSNTHRLLVECERREH